MFFIGVDLADLVDPNDFRPFFGCPLWVDDHTVAARSLLLEVKKSWQAT
jgi:hypothetical protein